MAVATGSQILLLKNDVVVTTGWLFRLLRALHGDPAIGLVGPCSNFVSGCSRWRPATTAWPTWTGLRGIGAVLTKAFAWM